MDSYSDQFVTSLADDDVRARAEVHAEAFFADAKDAVNAQHRRTKSVLRRPAALRPRSRAGRAGKAQEGACLV
jgi:hypothetical protein